MATTRQESQRRAVLVLLAGALALTVMTFWPLAQALFLAAVLALALGPAYRRLLPHAWGKPYLAGGILVAGVVLLVLAPLVILTAQIASQARDVQLHVAEILRTEGIEGLVADLPGPAERLARAVLARLPHAPGEGYEATLQRQLSASGSKLAASLGSAVAATGSALFQAAMMLIALFALLTEGDRVLELAGEYSPLGRERTLELLEEFRQASVAVIQGSVVTAVAQAIVGWIGFAIARTPQPLFFAVLTFLLAFLPAVGATGMVLVVAALMAVTGHPAAAVFLAVWGIVVEGLVNSLVKTLVIRGGAQLNGVVVFFSLVGGFAAFGAIGLVLGPLAVALLEAVLRIYRRDFPTGASPAPRGLPLA